MFTVYKTINIVNGRYYIGAHKTDNLEDTYLGSGLAIKRAIKFYGRDKFIKEILTVVNTEQEMYDIERQLVDEHISDPLCYNLMEGGIGGFTHINKHRHLYTNPMKDPTVVARNLQSRRAGYGNDPQRVAAHKEIRKQNVQKAISHNTGKKRPQHSNLMKEKSALYDFWSNKEEARNKLSSTFEVRSPTGELYITNRLEDFCIEHGLVYVSVWNSSRTNKPVTKGSSKGWKCHKI